ncbi:MAG TPA: type IV pilin protein [Burkholderiales bacterium]|nr:type IV pilin protein [Burkholderiales bacterium]
MKSNQGFTLLELMITVTIVAILSAIALPNYNNYVARGQAVVGVAALAEYRVRMEQFYQDNRTYAGAGGGCGVALPTGQHFKFDCASGGQTYTATATGNGGRVVGLTYTIDQSNNRATTDVPTGWTGKGNACWVTRKSGDC